jgi:hypothetical protein
MDVVPASLNYLAPESTRNLRYVAADAVLTTTAFTARTMSVADGRPRRAEFTLDRAGFTLLDHQSAVSDFRDPAELARRYVAEGRALVSEVTGADHVVSLGWVLRSAGARPSGGRAPGDEVHVDMHPGPAAAARFAEIHQAQGVPGKAFRRAICTSLWRTFSPPPQDWPLAICDYRSTDDAEGLPNVMIMVDRLPRPEEVPDVVDDTQGQQAGTVFPFNPAHRWWYFPGMHAGEALLFKLCDTDHSVAWRTPHSAFRDPTVSPSHPRESVELRTVAFFY